MIIIFGIMLAGCVWWILTYTEARDNLKQRREELRDMLKTFPH